MKNNKDNPTNSSVLQSLLDLKTIAIEKNKDIVLQNIVNLLNALHSEKQVIVDADKKFNAHRYNESKMEFVKLSSIDKTQVICALSSDACKILFFMCQAISQEGLLELPINTASQLLNLERRRVSKAISELVDFGCITVIQKANKKGKIGNIYMVNPDICYSGKNKNQARFEIDVNEKEQSRLETYEINKSIDCSIQKSYLKTCNDSGLSYKSVICED